MQKLDDNEDLIEWQLPFEDESKWDDEDRRELAVLRASLPGWDELSNFTALYENRRFLIVALSMFDSSPKSKNRLKLIGNSLDIIIQRKDPNTAEVFEAQSNNVLVERAQKALNALEMKSEFSDSADPTDIINEAIMALKGELDSE